MAYHSRNIESSLQLLQRLQANGARWMAGVQSREQVAQSLSYYLTKCGIDAHSLPPLIHIAGTKGKGTTATITEQILHTTGFRTGLFTSPHILSVTERFRVGCQDIGEAEYLDSFWTIWDAVSSDALNDPGLSIPKCQHPMVGSSIYSADPTIPSPLPPPLPGFAMLLLVGLRIFIEKKVDTLILEAGVGGTLDPTNALPLSRYLASGITLIDFDHTNLLGKTITDITSEKAGIIKPGVPVFTLPQVHSEVLPLLQIVSRAQMTRLYVCNESTVADTFAHSRSEYTTPPEFRSNSALAVALADAVMHRIGDYSTRPSILPFPTNVQGPEDGPKPSEAVACQPNWKRTGIRPPELQLEEILTTKTWTWDMSSNESMLKSSFSKAIRNASMLGRWQIIGVQESKEGKLMSVSMHAEELGSENTAPLENTVQFYLDGAHTAHSITRSSSWFQWASASAIPTGTSSKKTLLFYCGIDRSVFSLFLPLLEMDWDEVVFADIDHHDQPEKSSVFQISKSVKSRNARTASELFIQELRNWTQENQVPMEKSIILLDKANEILVCQDVKREIAISFEDKEEPAGTSSPQTVEPNNDISNSSWAQLLGSFWELLHSDKGRAILQLLSDELSLTLSQKPAPVKVYSSVAPAIRHLCSNELDVPTRCHQVFATGSMYLVGAILSATNWKNCPK